MSYYYLIEIIALVCGLLGIVLGAFAAELMPPVQAWIAARTGFADAAQSVPVRCCAIRLASHRSRARLAAARMLSDINDPTAVPALVRAANKYRKDVPLLEVIVHALSNLCDPRGLDTLGRLSTGHNASLMLAARTAKAHVERETTLLRSAEAPNVQMRTLVSPAGLSESTDPAQLLRSMD